MSKPFKRACPWCSGEGSFLVDIISEGIGPRDTCDVCKGEGELTDPAAWGRAMGWLSGLARLDRRAAKRRAAQQGEKA